jgi:hypothetical protein
MKKTRLYISGLWLVEGNPKRSPEHYYKQLPKTFELIRGCDLMFYCSQPSVEQLVTDLAKEYSINVQIKHFDVKSHEHFKLTQDACLHSQAFHMEPWSQAYNGLKTHEAGLQLFLFQNNTSLEFYTQVNACFMSKTIVVEQHLQEIQHDEIFWIDASVSRFIDKRKHWNFTQVDLQEDKISHYSSGQRIFGKRQPVQGSLLGGTKSSWENFIPLFASTLREYVDSGCIYPAPDETIFMLCHAKHPELFACIDSPPRNFLHKAAGKLFFTTNMNSFLLKSLK